MGIVTTATNKHQACIDSCNRCAQECDMFQDEHCPKCANECRACAEQCRNMASM